MLECTLFNDNDNEYDDENDEVNEDENENDNGEVMRTMTMTKTSLINHRLLFIIVFPVDVAVACEHIEHAINVCICVTEAIVVNSIAIDLVHNGRNDFFVYGLLDFMLAFYANQGHDIVVEIALYLCQKVTVDALGGLIILVSGGFLAIPQLLTVGIVIEFFAESTIFQLLLETNGFGQFCLICLYVISYLLQMNVLAKLIL